MSLMMSRSPFDMSEELSMKLSQAKAMAKTVGSDCLVPTTVNEQEDVGYHSDDFYLQDHKTDQSAGSSGTSTPFTIEDMDLFTRYAETWRTELSTTDKMPDVQGAVEVNVFEDLNVGRGGQTDIADCFSDHSDDTEEDSSDLPEILRRSVKGMTQEEKRLRRKELNRLAARRSRQKKRQCSATQQTEETRLIKRNAELKVELTKLEKAKTELYSLIKNHFKNCNPNSNSNIKQEEVQQQQQAPAIQQQAPAVHSHAQHTADTQAPAAVAYGYYHGCAGAYN